MTNLNAIEPYRFITNDYNGIGCAFAVMKNAQRMNADKTLTFSLIEYQSGQLKVVGQHEGLLVVRKGGRVERIDTVDLGFPLGLEPEVEDWVAVKVVLKQI